MRPQTAYCFRQSSLTLTLCKGLKEPHAFGCLNKCSNPYTQTMQPYLMQGEDHDKCYDKCYIG
jgi:hypothetical protein